MIGVEAGDVLSTGIPNPAEVVKQGESQTARAEAGAEHVEAGANVLLHTLLRLAA